MEIDLDDSLTGLFDDFFGFLPNLIGAAIIFAVGSVMLLAPPWLVWSLSRQKVADRWPAAAKVLTGLLYLWLFLAGLVILSLTINTLGIEWLTNGFNTLIGWLPPLIVAAVVLGGLGFAVYAIRSGEQTELPGPPEPGI